MMVYVVVYTTHALARISVKSHDLGFFRYNSMRGGKRLIPNSLETEFDWIDEAKGRLDAIMEKMTSSINLDEPFLAVKIKASHRRCK